MPAGWLDEEILERVDGAIAADALAQLLEDDPTADTGVVDASYSVTYAGIFVVKEDWRRSDTTLIKEITYTYDGSKVTTEVRKVFNADGVTVFAQITWSFTYVGIKLIGGSMVRDV
jgi:ABC-type metal ion transport system substrate-binding protein